MGMLAYRVIVRLPPRLGGFHLCSENQIKKELPGAVRIVIIGSSISPRNTPTRCCEVDYTVRAYSAYYIGYVDIVHKQIYILFIYHAKLLKKHDIILAECERGP